MNLKDKMTIVATSALVLAGFGGIGYMASKVDKELDALENIKAEIKEKDPERYERMMQETGKMQTEESRIFLWENAYKEMNDSLIYAAYKASSNYTKASLNMKSDN